MFFFDYRELKKYAEEINNLSNNANNATKEFLMQTANECVENIKRDTPVDTGLLKTSWYVGNLQRYKDMYSVDIINPIEYASFMEDGWSTTGSGVKQRFIPGYWVGGKFVYVPNASEGMTLKHKKYEGKHMMRINVNKTQYRLNSKYNKFIAEWFKNNSSGVGKWYEDNHYRKPNKKRG